jgi:hypothetical protein
MQTLPRDVLSHCLLPLLDGKGLCRLRATCKTYRDMIDADPVLRDVINLHIVRLDSHLEFYEEIGSPIVFNETTHYYGGVLEGKRQYATLDGYHEITDFYVHGNFETAVEYIRSLKIKTFKFIIYPPLGGNLRHTLGNGLGTIHRGGCVWIKW